jgi:predicted dehydrogenase
MRSILNNSETDCIALCDIDDKVLEERLENVKDITGKKPKIYKDYRKLLENKDIDAVVIGTPDHWHCLNLVDALHAGKHIYCEKPISNSTEAFNIMSASSIEFEIGFSQYICLPACRASTKFKQCQ